MKIDFGSQTPIFLQLSQGLEDEILSGIYREGENMRLCSIASGSSGNCIYTGSDNTHLLVDAGIVYKKRGIGMFVSQGALQLLKEKRQDEFFQQYVLPMVQEAKRLSIQPETLRDWIERGFAE